MKKSILMRVLPALSLAALATTASHATTVSPMVIDLQTSGRNVVANISVHNTSDKPLTMETVIQSLDPKPEGLVQSSAKSDDLLVMPPTALIAPGKTQAFRVQWIGDPAPSASHHYYVGINQLPVKLPEGESAVQIVYNFNVLVSVGSTSGKPALAITSAQIGDSKGKPAPSLTVTNSGSTYGYLSQHKLHLVEKDSAGKVSFDRTVSGNEFEQLVGYGIIATGQSRNFVLPIELPSRSGTLSIVLDERGK